jgi:hypothetical protein
MSPLGFPTRNLALTAALFTVAGTAFGSTIRAKITGQEKLQPDVYVEAAKADGHRYSWREPSPTVKQEFRNLTANPSRDVCIAAISGNVMPPHEPILVKVTGGHTIPTTLVISQGTRLSFEVRDPFPHRLYQVQNDQWGPQDTNAAAHREWTAAGEGRFEFRDALFPSIRMYVIVDKQVADVAFPGRDGNFAMNLPAGTYVLKAFFMGKQVGRDVSVASKEKGVLDLKESLNVGEGAGQ